MTVLDHTLLTVDALVTVFAGREATGLRTLRDAARRIEESVRGRILADAHALGTDPEALAKLLDGEVAPPVKRIMAHRAKPTRAPNVDEATLRELLFAELDKGSASALALSRRTGATKERITTNLTCAANSTPPLAAIHGIKWARVKA